MNDIQSREIENALGNDIGLFGFRRVISDCRDYIMRLQLHLQTCWVIILLIVNDHRSLSVKFEDNGYEISVAIHRSVPENVAIITQLTKMLESASDYLYMTTRKYVYIKHVNILVPDTWTRNSEWRQENDITFSQADIRVDSPHPAQNNTPYTFNPGQCGEEGRYIHLTPDFVLDNENERDRRFGTVGRLLVHEFAHLRFGVFDEYGIRGSSQHPIYYTDDTGPKARPTGCSHEISGIFVDEERNRSCTEEDLTEEPPSDRCSFQVRKTGNVANASVMFAQFLEEVTEFCESETEDEKLKHNADAPNLHNKMCRETGTWNVIREHPDVKFSNPDAIDNRQPTFQVVQRQTNVNGKRVCGRRFAFVLDVSGSMVNGNGMRYFRLRQIADMTIRDIFPVGTEVGIVVFSSAARIWSNMTFLTSAADRDTLAQGLPKYADFGGNTAVGLGLKEAINMLNMNGKSADKARLFLITDGKENMEPVVKEIMSDILREKVVVHTMAYSDSAADVLERLSDQTGGQYSYFDESSTSVALDGAAERLLSDISLCKEEDPIVIDRHSVLLTSTTTTCERDVLMDSTIGNNTLFVFTLSKGAATEVTLQDPSGNVIDAGSPYYRKDKTLNIVRYRIPLAQVGKWKYKLKRGSKLEESIVGVVKSHPRDDVQPFEVETWKSSSSFNVSAGDVPVVYVYVHKGYAPVLKASVEVTVTRAAQEPFKPVLNDKGEFPDNTANDGVYTSYLVDFRSNSRFSIEVKVESVGETVLLKSGNRLSGRALTLYPSPYQPEVLIPVEGFSRTASGGAIDITGYDPTLDQLDPGRITDLYIAIHDKANLSVTLTWTAPGDDLNTGTVTRYEIRIAKSFNDLRDNFTSETLVETNDVLNGSLNPLPAGAQQSVVIRLPSNWSHDVFVVGLKAYDEASRSSGLSNLRSFTFKSLILPSIPIPSTDGGSGSKATLWIGIGIGVTVLAVILIIVIIASILCFRKKHNASYNVA